MGCGGTKIVRTGAIKSHRVKELKIEPGNFVVSNPKSFQEVYAMGKTLGNGAFGEVRQAIHRESKEQRAVKIFRKDLAIDDVNKQKLMEEIDILRSLDHPNIVRIYEFFEDSKKSYIVMEQCKGGELFEQILKRQSFSENVAATVMSQILSAISYLHSKHIVHRDLKPENVLLEEKGNDMNLKLIDFGAAVRIKPGTYIKGALGTAYYIAPEVLTSSYNWKCDLWSCGVLCFILLSGYPPFDGKNDEEILTKVKKCSFSFNNPCWQSISNGAKDFISCLLSPAGTRISAESALSHPWLREKSKTPEISHGTMVNAMTNLRTFQKRGKLREAVSTFITTQCVSLADKAELNKVFKAMDTNGDGKLSKDELFQYFVKEMGVEAANEEVDKIMSQVDSDGSGYVDYTEFIKATLDYKILTSQGFLKRAFKLFDKDESGTISASELKKILAGGNVYDDSIWAQIIKEVDLNGDGEIDIGEFENIILSKI